MKRAKRERFNFRKEWAEIIRQQSDVDRLQIYDAMCSHSFFGGYDEGRMSDIAGLAMRFISRILDEDKANCLPQGRLESSYRSWRKAVLERDGYTCQGCGKQEKGLHVHHIKPYALYPELRLDVNNGITLCRECHVQAHKELRTWTI